LTLSEEKDHPRLRALAHTVSATEGWDRVPVEEVFVEETGSVIAYKGACARSPTTAARAAPRLLTSRPRAGYGRPTLSDTAALTSVADVLLINYGAHYHALEEYEADMGPLFESLGDFNRQPCKVSIFRETSMQAFDETGVWEPGSDKTTSRCSATSPAVAASNRIALQNGVVARLGREQRVPILPYYNASLARWDSYEEKYWCVYCVRQQRERSCLTRLCRLQRDCAAPVRQHGAMHGLQPLLRESHADRQDGGRLAHHPERGRSHSERRPVRSHEVICNLIDRLTNILTLVLIMPFRLLSHTHATLPLPV